MIYAITLILLGLAPALKAEASSTPIECTFSNPRYAGQCVEQVTPAEKQTPVQACRAILDCLNNSQCVKTYCNATTVRGGWRLESPKDDKNPGSPVRSPSIH
ncbi:MAG: hypothetical protein ACM36C_04115 [Acidobacteriota bacterium]